MPEVEMPGGPSLDHYYGRGVEGVETADDKTWEIILSGDVRLKNYNMTLDAPDNLGGLSLLTGIFSEEETRLVFGIGGPNANPDRNVEVAMNPIEYSITDPSVAGGEHFPQKLDVGEPESTPEGTNEVEGEETAEGSE
jgi:hypothetical protein